jgi:hypothetical protein
MAVSDRFGVTVVAVFSDEPTLAISRPAAHHLEAPADNLWALYILSLWAVSGVASCRFPRRCRNSRMYCGVRWFRKQSGIAAATAGMNDRCGPGFSHSLPFPECLFLAGCRSTRIAAERAKLCAPALNRRRPVP